MARFIPLCANPYVGETDDDDEDDEDEDDDDEEQAEHACFQREKIGRRNLDESILHFHCTQ